MLIHFNYSRWVDDLLKRTNNLRQHCVVQGLLQNPDYIQELICSAFEQISSSGKDAILRVFINRGQRYDLMEILRGTRFSRDQGLDKWI